MNWLQFKQAVEKQGVLNTDTITTIDINLEGSDSNIEVNKIEFEGETEIIIFDRYVQPN